MLDGMLDKRIIAMFAGFDDPDSPMVDDIYSGYSERVGQIIESGLADYVAKQLYQH